LTKYSFPLSIVVPNLLENNTNRQNHGNLSREKLAFLFVFSYFKSEIWNTPSPYQSFSAVVVQYSRHLSFLVYLFVFWSVNLPFRYCHFSSLFVTFSFFFLCYFLLLSLFIFLFLPLMTISSPRYSHLLVCLYLSISIYLSLSLSLSLSHLSPPPLILPAPLSVYLHPRCCISGR
jgi:hypothetical protein